jgi:hypothetical protein
MMDLPPFTPAQMHDLAELAREDRRERELFDGKEQITNPERLTRRCSTCGEPESKRRDLRPTQYLAGEGRKLSPANLDRWQNTVHWSCQKCRRKYQGLWRVPSYHPQAGREDHVCYAQQLVPDVRAITLQEPWAWLVAEGFKDCENRGINFAFEGRVFIHSAKSLAGDFKQLENWIGTHLGIMLPGVEWLRKNHMGRIVAVADFAPMKPYIDSPWKQKGKWAWPINWCHRIAATPVVRGQLGLWRLPTDLQRINVLP